MSVTLCCAKYSRVDAASSRMRCSKLTSATGRGSSRSTGSAASAASAESRFGEAASSSTLSPLAPARSAAAAAGSGAEDVGSAQQPRAAAVGERGAAPLADGGERRHGLGPPRRIRSRAGVDDGGHRRVRPFLERAKGAEHLAHPRFAGGQGRPPGAGRVEQLDSGEAHAALGERAGLVQADDVHPGQALDRGQFLHEAVALPEPHHADREGHRRQQHQAFRHHRHDPGDGPAGPLAQPARDARLHDDLQNSGRDQQVRQES